MLFSWNDFMRFICTTIDIKIKSLPLKEKQKVAYPLFHSARPTALKKKS